MKADSKTDELRGCVKCKEGLLEVVEGGEIWATHGHYYWYCPRCKWIRGISFPKEFMRRT